MYPACILKDTRILMYPDVSQTYLTCVLCYIRREYKYLDKLTFCMYCTRIPKDSKIHLEYISDTSGYMYLARFLGVTLDTYQDTSGYVYLGLFITIHAGHTEIHAGYIQDSSWIHAGYIIHVSAVVRGYIGDTCGIHPIN